MDKLENLVSRTEGLVSRLEQLLPAQPIEPDWNAIAWRWMMQSNHGCLQAVSHPHQIALNNIQFVDAQKTEIVRNTRQFLQGFPANHVLLTGARGTGKSSLVKALLNAYAKDGLRLIEVEKQDLVHLGKIVDLVRSRNEKFIIFCDDLSFEANDVGYKALKVVLDGSIADNSDNVLIYATSNRKNLMPEFMADNLALQHSDGEIRPNETLDEKVALAERFGLWLSFYPFDQEEYLKICEGWLATFNVPWNDAASRAALSFSHTRGMRSGRVAYQFARDYAGKLALK
ncbi:MAG TPA: ATP-binding protein [Methylophilus sp.]|nr:ATP-binding protein [Methylophilus sp.]HQQ33625.1 ATP-binding protein [Methylophilus sp.]